jgi:hypothetical protein
MSGRDWDIIPKFTYPMQSNFEQFMCSWDRNPKFSPFEGMTLALQAHLFNRLYTRQGGQNWSLKPIYWALPPQGLSATIALDPSFGSLGRTTNMGHVPWLYGKWNYEQCFSAGNEGRKRYTKQRVDIIIYIRGEFWPEVFFGRNFTNWLTKKKKAQCDLYNGFLLKIFKKKSHIS